MLSGQYGWSIRHRAVLAILRLWNGGGTVLALSDTGLPIAPSVYTIGYWAGGYEDRDTVRFLIGTERRWEQIPLPCNSSGIAAKVEARVFVTAFPKGEVSVFSPKLPAITGSGSQNEVQVFMRRCSQEVLFYSS